MVKEIFPSSYECACGYQLDFCDRTIRDLKRMSERKQQRLIADDEKHGCVCSGMSCRHPMSCEQKETKLIVSWAPNARCGGSARSALQRTQSLGARPLTPDLRH